MAVPPNMHAYRLFVCRRFDHLYLAISILSVILLGFCAVNIPIKCTRNATELGETILKHREATTKRIFLRCHDRDHEYKIAQKGQFWVLYNYIPAERWFACDESVTFATTADIAFLDNLEPLVRRWKGPVSFAVYVPGTDFHVWVESVRYARSCYASIRQYVSFHAFFDDKHVPATIPKRRSIFGNDTIECSASPPWQTVNTTQLYRTQNKLYFPINVGRNIARDAATTHFILAADIELYPSVDVIPDFLQMIRNQNSTSLKLHQVYVLPPFEVATNFAPPANKDQLVNMLKNRTAIPFHQSICSACHRIPKLIEWIRAKITPTLQIFSTAKRRNTFWEPFYIGTNKDPLFDERLSWEGRSDKMTQAYAMCVLDYDYHILNNAFLIHKPGIKKVDFSLTRAMATPKNVRIIEQKSTPEIHQFFGTNDACSIIGKSKLMSIR